MPPDRKTVYNGQEESEKTHTSAGTGPTKAETGPWYLRQGPFVPIIVCLARGHEG